MRRGQRLRILSNKVSFRACSNWNKAWTLRRSVIWNVNRPSDHEPLCLAHRELRKIAAELTADGPSNAAVNLPNEFLPQQ